MFFGLCWGFSCVAFSISVNLIGQGSALTIAFSCNLLLGTLLPMFYHKEESTNIITDKYTMFICTSLVLVLIGMICIGKS
eukprot:UN29582